MAAAEPVSPLTPLYEPGFRYNPPATGYGSAYDGYYADGAPNHAGQKRRPSAISDGRSVSYEDDLYNSTTPATSTTTSSAATSGSERPGKRFPCRYRETHGCEKTFTTSGHASRHAKIHTAEKGVNCSFDGCSKKFTRADNMKQHLETHYKEKSRPSLSRPSIAGDRRSSSSSSIGKPAHSSAAAAAAASRNRIMAIATAAAAAAATTESSPSPPPPSLPRMNGLQPGLSPGAPTYPPSGSAWDMRDLYNMLVDRASTRRSLTSSTGLDTLAMAALRQGNRRQ